MSEGIIVIDKNGRIKSINPAAVQIMGTGPEHLGGDFFEITGQFPFYDHEGVNIPPHLRPALAVLRTGVPFFNQVFGFPRADGTRGWLMSSCRLLNPDKPGQSDMRMSFTDVTNERAVADKVMFYASHDALTELPNRVSVLRRLKKALAPTHEGEPLRWVLFIDIDELKATNDTHGHTVGDELLRAAANCLRGVVTAGDVVGRLGGDEFVVLIFRDLTRDELDGVIELLRRNWPRRWNPVRRASPSMPASGWSRCAAKISARPTSYSATPTSRCMRPSARTDAEDDWLPAWADELVARIDALHVAGVVAVADTAAHVLLVQRGERIVGRVRPRDRARRRRRPSRRRR